MTSRSARDTTTVRRALSAGALVWLGLGAALVAAVVRAGGGGGAGLVAVMAALVGGALVASAWLLLSATLDLIAEQPPGPWRVRWTVAVVLFTFASPLLVMGAQTAR